MTGDQPSLDDGLRASLPGTVAVTGAAGFIGGSVMGRFADHGCRVVGLDLAAAPGGDVQAADLCAPGDWQEALRDVDVVVHTAAIVSNSVPMPRCWEANVLALRHVIDAMPTGARLVHLSSVRAYSDLDFPDQVDEHHPVRPDGHAYVDTKIASEQVAFQAHAAGEARVVILRPGDVYGPGSKPWTLWPVLGMPAGMFFVPDDGSHVFSPVYVDNLVDAIVLAAVHPDADGQVFNVTDGAGTTNAAFFGCYADMLGIELPVLPADEIRRRFSALADADRAAGREPTLSADTVDYLLRRGTYSIARARRVLGFEPAVDLEEGMARTRAWLRASGLVS